MGLLVLGAKGLVQNGNSRKEIRRGAFPNADRPLSGQSWWNSWDLKSNRAITSNPANLLFWSQANRFTPNDDNMINQPSQHFMRNYVAMLDKDFHRTPKELEPESFQRYPMSSQHGLLSTRRGVIGVGSSRQQVLGDGIGFSHFQTTGNWKPLTGGSAMASSYQIDIDQSILHDDLLSGETADQQPGGLFAQKKLFLRR